jgi:hypothetical protein
LGCHRGIASLATEGFISLNSVCEQFVKARREGEIYDAHYNPVAGFGFSNSVSRRVFPGP